MKWGNVDVRQLRYFLAVVDAGSVHRAAEDLFVSQPSVSQALRRLERDLGADLFHRTGRWLVLTPAGRALVEPARDVLRSLAVARTTVHAVDGLRGGRLLVSSMPSQAVSPLAPLIRRFRDRYPGVEVGVSTAAQPADVIDTVRRGRAEVGLVAVPNRSPVEPGLRFHLLEVQSYLLVTGPAAPLPCGDGPLRVDQLPDLPLVIGQPGTGMRRVADEILAASGCTVAVEIEHREALLPLVLAGVGAAVVADSWRSLARSAGLLVRPIDTAESLHVGLVTAAARPSPAASALLAVAQDRPDES